MCVTTDRRSNLWCGAHRLANVGDYLATHNGGQRWPGNEASAEYQTLLQWIRGARLDAPVSAPVDEARHRQ